MDAAGIGSSVAVIVGRCSLTASIAAGCGGPPRRARDRPAPSRSGSPRRATSRRALPVLVAAVHRRRPGVEVVADLRRVGPACRADQGRGPVRRLPRGQPRRSSRTWPPRGFVRPDSVRPYAPGTLVLAVHREAGVAIAEPGRPDEARGQEDRAGQPRLRPLRGRRQAGARAGGALGRRSSRRSSRPSRSARRSSSSSRERRGRAGRARRSPTAPRSGSSTIDPALYDPIVQGLGIVARTEHAGRRPRRSRGSCSGPRGRRSWQGFGFKAPDAESSHDVDDDRTTSPRSGSRSGSPRWRRSLIVAVGRAAGARAGAGAVPGQGAARGGPGRCRWSCRRRCWAITCSSSSAGARWLGLWLERTLGGHDRLPLDGGGGRVGGGGVPAVPAAGAGGVRGGRPGAGGRGAAARPPRAVGLPRGDAPAGLARAGGRARCSRSPGPWATSARR